MVNVWIADCEVDQGERPMIWCDKRNTATYCRNGATGALLGSNEKEMAAITYMIRIQSST